MMYEMQIKIEKTDKATGRKYQAWSSVRPTGGTPYRYKTEREAREMLGICYGEVDPECTRVIKVDGAI